MVNGRGQHCIGTPGGRTPLHVCVILDKAVRNQMLKLLLHIGLTKKLTGVREGRREGEGEKERERERKREGRGSGREGEGERENNVKGQYHDI